MFVWEMAIALRGYIGSGSKSMASFALLIVTKVTSTHEAHEVPGLYVADPSVFPLPPSVDPSLTIMAFSVIAARSILSHLA